VREGGQLDFPTTLSMAKEVQTTKFCQCIRKAPVPVAPRSKAYVCGHLTAGVAGWNPARSMDVCLLFLYVVLSYVGRGLCDGLITRPDESYRVSVCV
jgi:hypothetical protein